MYVGDMHERGALTGHSGVLCCVDKICRVGWWTMPVSAAVLEAFVSLFFPYFH